MYQPRSSRAIGPGTIYTGFGDERRAPRTQAEIRQDLAERAEISRHELGERDEAQIARAKGLAPVVGEIVMSTQEIHGAGPAAEQVVSQPAAEVMGRVATATQAEVA